MNKQGKTKRSTAFILLGIGILLIAIFGGKMGLFSVTSDDLRNCILGETKCCSYSDTYCQDVSGGTLLFTCTKINYQNGSFAYNRFFNFGNISNCQSNVLTRIYYSLPDCDSVYKKIADKTSNDYSEMIDCIHNRNLFKYVSDNNQITDYVCSCQTGKWSCSGFTYFLCENSQWTNKGIITGQCGKNCNGLGGRAYEYCMYANSNYTKPDKSCDIYIPPTPTCLDGIKNGVETGIDCGGSCNDCGTNGTTDGFSLNNTFIKIGDFNITWLMLLIAIAIIVLLIVIK